MANEKRLIDANAVHAKLEKIYSRLIANLERAELAAAIRCVDDLISEAPTVDAVEVVHGRWLGWHGDKMVAEDEYRHYHFNTCSECGKGSAVKFNYCPNCGAKMDGEDVNEERNEAESES